MSREKKKKENQPIKKKKPTLKNQNKTQKDFKLPSHYQKPVITCFHPNKRCFIFQAVTSFKIEILQGRVPRKKKWVTSVH